MTSAKLKSGDTYLFPSAVGIKSLRFPFGAIGREVVRHGFAEGNRRGEVA